VWGQFLDHDISLTIEAYPLVPFYIAVPEGDLYFDPDSEGNKYIVLNRSSTNYGIPREQFNLINAFIDASNVYGSDDERAATLRTFYQGKLDTSKRNFLPYNTEGLDNAGGPDPKLFLAGDVRANEQIALIAMHTLFVREHNRLCDEIASEHSYFTDEEIYQWARKIVGAQMQVITYNEFLPVVLGQDAFPIYRGYKANVDPGVTNEFSTAAYRFGHSMLSTSFLRKNKPGNELVSTSLQDAFFNPQLIRNKGGIEAILRGMAFQLAQEIDNKIVNDVRNFLFGQPGEGGFDLAALNIQRGRDHGLADYNSVRKAYGLKKRNNWEEITSDSELQMFLAEKAYSDIDDIDPWVAGLAEDKVPGAIVGEMFHAIITDQFVRLRDGDRFYYLNDPFFNSNPDLLNRVENTMLSDIIRRNTEVGDDFPDNVFLID
jgi:hypothetical protein